MAALMKGCGNVAPAPVKVAGPGVAFGEPEAEGLGVGVGLIEGLGDVDGFDKKVYAKTPLIIMTIATIAAAIAYEDFILVPRFW